MMLPKIERVKTPVAAGAANALLPFTVETSWDFIFLVSARARISSVEWVDASGWDFKLWRADDTDDMLVDEAYTVQAIGVIQNLVQGRSFPFPLEIKGGKLQGSVQTRNYVGTPTFDIYLEFMHVQSQDKEERSAMNLR